MHAPNEGVDPPSSPTWPSSPTAGKMRPDSQAVTWHPHDDGRTRKDHLVAIEWAIPFPGGTL
jgi:hypothetical protein